MSDNKFDRLLSEIRDEQIDERVVSRAGERVWNSITASAPIELSAQAFGSCEDFQALIPFYLSKALPQARALLFEDHVHECVACRRAVERARTGEMQPTWQVKPASRGLGLWRFAM